MKISSECKINPETIKKSKPAITRELLRWWSSLNQQQKLWYCQLHPQSELTLGHLGKCIFSGFDAKMMRQYHKEQAADLRSNIVAAIDPYKKRELEKHYKMHVNLSKGG